MHLHCFFVLWLQQYVHVCWRNFESLFAWRVKFFVFVCFQVEERGGQFAAGDRRMKWRKREGNDEGLLSETATLPLSCCLESWRHTHAQGHWHTHMHAHTYTGCCCCDCDKTTGSEAQEGKHRTCRIERNNRDSVMENKKVIECFTLGRQTARNQ